MANEPAEASEVTVVSKALVLNLGTPNSNSFQAMLIAGRTANKLGIPVIFDPVGAGSTSFRRELCHKLLAEVKPAVIKGNLSEIKYLAGYEGSHRGIDSASSGEEALEPVKRLAVQLNCIAACTGTRDVVSDGNNTYIIKNGHEMLGRITGTGCMTAALAGVFCGVTEDWLIGTLGAVAAMGICGRLAFDSLKPGEGPGTFRARLLDKIYFMDEAVFLKEGLVDAV
jgi:hydroxyethylthiazole kinase